VAGRSAQNGHAEHPSQKAVAAPRLGRSCSAGRDRAIFLTTRRWASVNLGGRPPLYFGYSELNPPALKLRITSLTRSSLVNATFAIDDLVHQEKVRYVGCSNFLTYQLVRAIGRSETLRLARFDSVQPRYNLLFRQIEREMLPFCGEEGVGVIPYNPIAGGLLSGKHSRTAPPPEGTRFTLGSAAEAYQDRYWHDREFDTVEVLRQLAQKAGVSLVTLSVAWILANKAITAPIIGASRPEQLDSSLASAEFTLDDDLKYKLDECTHQYRMGDAPR